MRDSDAGPGLAVPNLAHWVLVGITVALTLLVPIRFLPGGALGPVVGVLLMVVGVVLWIWGLSTLRRRGTPTGLDRVPAVLVDDGPYRLSRNPTYLGLVVVFAGIAVGVNSIWLLGFASVELVLADRQARREEAYLESFFGGAYADYRTRVRRWV